MILREVFNGVLSGRLMCTKISSLVTMVKKRNILAVLLMISNNLFRFGPLLHTIKPQDFLGRCDSKRDQVK